jgi:hypothetical protein
VCGMSVVGPEFETLRRFNLAEIQQAGRGADGVTSAQAGAGAKVDAAVGNDEENENLSHE